jgi:CheY-like chemotaxis protein
VPRRILLVDDESFITSTVSARLRAAGDEVACASDGEEALQLIEEFQPQIVVSDFQMPVMNGFELACQLKSAPATSQLPIIMLTARGHALSDADLARTNIRHLLAKPFSVRDLLAKVDELSVELQLSRAA